MRRSSSLGSLLPLLEVRLSQAERGSVVNPHTYNGDPCWQADGRERGYVGLYSPAERRRRIDRFVEKRPFRVWAKVRGIARCLVLTAPALPCPVAAPLRCEGRICPALF
jgi:hypothetical protein